MIGGSIIARLAVTIALAIAAVPIRAEIYPVSDRSPDHVLVWTRNIDEVTAILAVKLGFQVRPGGEFDDGVANRIVRFPNRSYLELLYFSRSPDQLKGDARQDYARTAHGTLAYNFGIQAADVDATAQRLRGNGWKLDPEIPMIYDPDGDGPLPAQESPSRIVSFPDAPLSASDMFFIHYKNFEPTPTQRADGDVFTRHPNGALQITSVWLLSGDPEAEAARLDRLGFARGQPVVLGALGLQGLRYNAGAGSILVLQPSGPGPAADALAARGAHLYGVGIEVADLDRARRIVERGYGQKVTAYRGVSGDAFAAPTLGELGVVIEFHAPPVAPKNGESQ